MYEGPVRVQGMPHCNYDLPVLGSLGSPAHHAKRKAAVSNERKNGITPGVATVGTGTSPSKQGTTAKKA